MEIENDKIEIILSETDRIFIWKQKGKLCIRICLDSCSVHPFTVKTKLSVLDNLKINK